MADLGTNADLNGAIAFNPASQWNIPVENAPVLWNSDQIMASLSTGAGLHPDFGSGTYDGISIGIPYVVVPADQPLVPFINNLYAAESDSGPFPIPDNPTIQGAGATSYNDGHLIVLQLDANGNLAKEYDFFQLSQNADGVWQGYASVFNLTGGDDQRPMGWTSANAAGLPEFPGLVTYDEVQAAVAAGGANGYIPHALAFTLSAWSIGSKLFGAAEHSTGGDGAAGFGMTFRLKADYQIDPTMSLADQVILNTLKIYGMVLVDNGANFFLSGVPDSRWDNSDLARLQAEVSGADFEVVDTTGLVPPQPVTIGSGPDSIVVSMSENPYQGNAQFTVSVDGTQIGGVQTVQALNSSNEVQTFTFLGDWSDLTQHKVTISYANPYSDANGSRGLLLADATYDGASIGASASALATAGSTTVDVGTIPVIGTGPDTLLLHIYETAYNGDAQFTISVNGVQIGGVQTAEPLISSSQPEDFYVNGNWGSGQQTVQVNYINGADNRNLFVSSMSYDGVTDSSNHYNLYGGGSASFLVGAAAPIGSGPDSLVVNLVENAYQGDAQFTVSVDGTQVGGIETATLSTTSPGPQAFTFLGNWGAGAHNVVVNFINGHSDANGGNALFVRGMSYDGNDFNNNVANLWSDGSSAFTVATGSAIGSGADTLALHLAENGYEGDAQFTVSVNGVQVGGVQSATMQPNGQAQDFYVLGNWGAGQQAVSVNFINGLSDQGGSRNLYVWGMSYDGVDYNDNVENLYGGGTASFLVGQAAVIGSGADSLQLQIREQAFQGDAQFTVSVDGVQVGGVQTATQSTTSPGPQVFTFDGDWGTGQHSVLVDFLNGATDRNLYVGGMSYDGVNYSDNVENLYGGGTASFQIGQAAVIGSGADSLQLQIREDASQGNAQFTVSVDGLQVGGVQTATETRTGPGPQTFTFAGDWGAGQHSVMVDFLNGAPDRNLYVGGMSYDGASYSNNFANLYGGGTASFAVGSSFNNQL
jgi:hypothetical protein